MSTVRRAAAMRGVPGAIVGAVALACAIGAERWVRSTDLGRLAGVAFWVVLAAVYLTLAIGYVTAWDALDRGRKAEAPGR